ncbi:hypothetical protein Vadar_009252 [Vaccinium darrowii]|uniref:Uncharacterized protein n=1 Tax=Vaccinium darrowii TaxID=229202 RepID=A0ACB7XZ71_9ERIC|nr:hypothetical protein Vadar_009252 [Vaccinium darrowii]
MVCSSPEGEVEREAGSAAGRGGNRWWWVSRWWWVVTLPFSVHRLNENGFPVVGEAFDVAYNNIYAAQKLAEISVESTKVFTSLGNCSFTFNSSDACYCHHIWLTCSLLYMPVAQIAGCKTVVLATLPTQDGSICKLFAKAPPQNFQAMVYAYRDETTVEFCRLEGRFCTQRNIRGLNNPTKQVEIRNFIQAHRLSLIGIVETKLRKENLDSAMRKCLPLVWCFTHNSIATSVARIVVAWDTICSSSMSCSCKESNMHTRSKLARFFGLEGKLEDSLRSGWQLVFVDLENDVLVLGDDPYKEQSMEGDQHSLTSITMVANLADVYLVDVAPDVNLKFPKFLGACCCCP